MCHKKLVGTEEKQETVHIGRPEVVRRGQILTGSGYTYIVDRKHERRRERRERREGNAAQVGKKVERRW